MGSLTFIYRGLPAVINFPQSRPNPVEIKMEDQGWELQASH